MGSLLGFGFVSQGLQIGQVYSPHSRAKVYIKQGGVGAVISLQLVHVPGEELKCGWRSDIVWVQSPEIHKLFVEVWAQLIGQALDDLVVEVVGQGEAVEVLYVVEIFDNFQAGLKGFNFGS